MYLWIDYFLSYTHEGNCILLSLCFYTPLCSHRHMTRSFLSQACFSVPGKQPELHSGVMVSTAASQQESPGFESSLSVCSLHGFSLDTLTSSCSPKTCRGVTGDSALPTGVSGCLSLCISPVTDRRPVHGGARWCTVVHGVPCFSYKTTFE